MNDPRVWALSNNNLGVAWGKLSKDARTTLPDAIKYFEAALSVYGADNHSWDWANRVNNLAGALAEMSQYDESYGNRARTYFDTAGDFITKKDHLDQWARMNANRAVLEIHESRTHEAVDLLTDVILAPGIGGEVLAEALNARGVARQEMDQDDEAIEDFTTVVHIGEAGPGLRTGALLNRARLFGERGKREESTGDYTPRFHEDGALFLRFPNARERRHDGVFGRDSDLLRLLVRRIEYDGEAGTLSLSLSDPDARRPP